jgi:hypothetical protein
VKVLASRLETSEQLSAVFFGLSDDESDEVMGDRDEEERVEKKIRKKTKGK